jgi:hypothetical protein
MKRFIAIATLTVLAVSAAEARDQSEKHPRSHKFWELLMSLSPADRDKYHSARKQAMTNPEVAAANERRKKAEFEYHKLLHREMLKADPSLAPLLNKISELRSHEDL